MATSMRTTRCGKTGRSRDERDIQYLHSAALPQPRQDRWYTGRCGVTTVAIVQARMGSTRLPGKVLLPIGKYPALYHTLTRTRTACFNTVLAIPDTKENDILAYEATGWGFAVFRGAEHDVLGRYATTVGALDSPVGIVVRITGDCPFVDRVLVARVVCGTLQTGYSSNFHRFRMYPRGLDCEAFDWRALYWANHEVAAAYDREHVTPAMQAFLGGYNVTPIDGRSLAHHRWTLDNEADYRFFKAVAERINCEPPHPTTAELLDLLEREPALAKINT